MRGKKKRITKAEMLGKLKRAYSASKMTKEERKVDSRKKALERIEKKKTKEKKRKTVVDTSGHEIKLTDYQKREMYRKAQRLKRRIKSAMISYDQCWNPTKRNVELLEKREHGIDDLKREYHDIMEAIGASSSDSSCEKFRRRKK